MEKHEINVAWMHFLPFSFFTIQNLERKKASSLALIPHFSWYNRVMIVLSLPFLLTPCPLYFWSLRRQWHPTPVLLPGKSHGQRSLVGCSPWGSLSRARLGDFSYFSLSCIGEGNGNPLQCSCLENPRDGGAWWAAVYGVSQSQTRLKQLSSSSSL